MADVETIKDECDTTQILVGIGQSAGAIRLATIDLSHEVFCPTGGRLLKVNTPFLLATTGERPLEISEAVLAERLAGSEAESCSELLAES